MTLVQLEYVLAIADSGSFVEAAKKAHVTQPALTTQVKNLESELDVLIFDRTKKPIIPTDVGKQIIEQARQVLLQSKKIPDIVSEFNTEIKGNLKIGIIPTVSPYLIPQFINDFNEKNPKINIYVQEIITQEIIAKVKNGELDAGIIATPIKTRNVTFIPLYYERFFGYVSHGHPYFYKDVLSPKNLKEDDLWLLKEGNCFRDQVINVCSDEPDRKFKQHFNYESHSIESLMRIVEIKNGITLVPELATRDLTEKKMEMVKEIPEINPMREISLVLSRQLLKKRLINSLKRSITSSLPKFMTRKPEGTVIDTDIKV